MKCTIKTTVISPLGTFESGVAEVELTPKDIIEVNQILLKLGKAEYFTIQNDDGKTIYFPPEVIQKSIVISEIKKVE